MGFDLNIGGWLQQGKEALGVNQDKGFNTSAAGAQQASVDLKALSELQWQRQMEGLARAQGQMQPSQSLYDRIYGTTTNRQQQPMPTTTGMDAGVVRGTPGSERGPQPIGPNPNAAASGPPPRRGFGQPLVANPPTRDFLPRSGFAPYVAPQSGQRYGFGVAPDNTSTITSSLGGSAPQPATTYQQPANTDMARLNFLMQQRR